MFHTLFRQIIFLSWKFPPYKWIHILDTLCSLNKHVSDNYQKFLEGIQHHVSCDPGRTVFFVHNLLAMKSSLLNWPPSHTLLYSPKCAGSWGICEEFVNSCYWWMVHWRNTFCTYESKSIWQVEVVFKLFMRTREENVAWIVFHFFSIGWQWDF